MTADEVKHVMTQGCYRDHEQVGNTITPIYKIRVCKGGILRWFNNYQELVNWMSEP